MNAAILRKGDLSIELWSIETGPGDAIVISPPEGCVLQYIHTDGRDPGPREIDISKTTGLLCIRLEGGADDGS